MEDTKVADGRVKLVLAPEVTRAMKARAAVLGMTLAGYVTKLAAQEGMASMSPETCTPCMWTSLGGTWRQV